PTSRARVAPNLEDVDEVGGERQCQVEIVPLVDERFHGQPVIELRAVDREPSRHTHRAAGKHHVRAQRHVRVGGIDGRLERVVGNAGIQRDATQAVQPQLEQREEARVGEVETELAGDVRKVAASIGHQKGVVVLQDELGQIGGDTGGEDVVVLADENV